MEADAVIIPEINQQYLPFLKEIQKIQSFTRRAILDKRLSFLIFKRNMALKIFNNWKTLKQNKKLLATRERWRELWFQLRKQNIEEDSKIEALSEINYLNPLAEETFSKGPYILTSKLTSKCHTRDTSYAEGAFKGILKKMQEEIDSLRHENLELKARKTLIPFINEEDSSTYDRFDLDNRRKGAFLENLEDHNEVEALEQSLLEKENSIRSLNVKLDYMNSAYETLEKENKYLKEDLKRRENFLQQKLQLEIYVKQLERQYQKLQEDLEAIKAKIIDKNEVIAEGNERKVLQRKYDELSSKYEGLKKQEEFFRKEAADKNQQLKEKIEYIMQIEDRYQGLQDTLKDLSITNRDYKNQKYNPSEVDKKLGMTERTNNGNIVNKQQTEELRNTITQQNTKIQSLSRENQISKEVNQTLVQLLKLKNIQIQTIKILSSNNQYNKEEAEKSLSKFQNEEKKLLKMLDTLMKQYEVTDIY